MNVVEKINLILKKANISKVNLSKYLGVSRQMIYNYLDGDNLSKMPNEKCQLLFDLLDVNSTEEILNIKIDNEYLEKVGSKIFNPKKNESPKNETINLTGLKKEDINIISDIVIMLKNIILEGKGREGESEATIEYIYNFIQNLGTNKELKYLLGYFSKNFGYTEPNKFVYDEKFMTFYISYSAHMPYNYNKPECIENIDYIKKHFTNQNEEFLCAMSQAKNTDDAIKMLIDELNNQNKLEDTVLIFFSDHYAYSMNQEMVNEQKKETDANLKTKTPFFIYSVNNDPKKIDKVNSTIDILPTISDLFGLEYNPNIYFGDSIFNDEYKGLVVFNDNTWFDGKIYYKGEENQKYDMSYIEKINAYAKQLLTLGGQIIETDYFRYHDLNNNERAD